MRGDVAQGGFDAEATARKLLQDAPCGIAVTDAEGRLLYLNGTLSNWVGVEAQAALQGKRLPDLLTGPGRLYFETQIAPMLRLQGFVREIACHLTRPGDAAPLPVLLNGFVRYDEHGAMQRVDYTLFDATERTSYEAELRAARREAEELARIVRRSPHAIMRLSETGEIQSWNRGARDTFGAEEAAALGRPVQELVGFVDWPGWWPEVVEALAEATEHSFEAILADGTCIDAALARIDDRRTPGSRPAYSLVLRDVTRRKRAEDKLRLLVGELNHRVKNILGVVSALARQTLRGPERRTFDDRLQALSRAHDMTTRDAGAPVPLADLLDIAVMAPAGPGRVECAGPPVLLPSAWVPSMTMVLHEMVTNALKYGALSVEDGRVRVSWEVLSDDGRVRLRWREDGGPPARPPERQGFGSLMMQSVVAGEFGGDIEVDYTDQGLRCEMTLTLPATGVSHSQG
jgi:PAS domain S-box-containing protein